jgi:spore coat protein U-like protein
MTMVLLLWLGAPPAVTTCSVESPDVAFGTYDVLHHAENRTDARIRVRCPKHTSYQVSLNAGQNSGGTYFPRYLQSGSWNLGYNLFANAARTQVWGDGSAGTTVMTETGTGNFQQITVYGSIPALQSVRSGTYSDVVTLTVVW